MRTKRTLARALGVALSATAVAAAAAIFPAGSSARVAPSVSVTAAPGSTAGATGSASFTINVPAAQDTPTDSVASISLEMPPGMLVNEQLAGGGCLFQPEPVAACLIGSGSAIIANTSTPAALYLVKSSSAAALAGVELIVGGLPQPVLGDLTFHSSSNFGINPSFVVSEEITLSGIPANTITSLSLTLAGLALPSSCLPSSTALSATSQLSTVPSAATPSPFSLTGCLALPYSPGVTETIARDTGSTGGVFTVNVLNAPGDSSTQSIRLRLPPNLALNPALDPCLAGQVCSVGTITATSPVIPASQLTGTLTLAGTVRAPAIKIAFPPPVNLQIFSTFSSTVLALYALPDIPMTNLTLNFTGNSLGRLFVVECYPAPFSAMLAPRSGGNGVNLDGAVTETGCRGHSQASTRAKPTASASLSGLAKHAPKLSLRATESKGGPGIVSVSVKLPSGLRFKTGAISRHALSVTGAKLASASLSNGTLVVTYQRASASSSLLLGGPLLIQAPTGSTHTGSHRAGAGRLSVTITDGSGRRTNLTLPIHS